MTTPKFSLKYVAGFFDGEGSVCISRSKRKDRLVEYVFFVGIGNTYFPVLEFLKGRFGGSLHLNLSSKKRKATYKPFLQWAISGKKAKRFLEQILPFLIVKKAQAKVGIAFQEFKSSCRINRKREESGKYKPDSVRFEKMEAFRTSLLKARQSNNFQYTESISREDLIFSETLNDYTRSRIELNANDIV